MSTDTDHSELNGLADRMHEQFPRMEHALKATRFLQADKHGGAGAAWDRFADEIDDEFQKLASRDEKLKEAVEYFRLKPPKKQIVVDAATAWQEAPADPGMTTKQLLVYVRRVRNNLFHGGKRNGQWFDPPRSEALLGRSLIILDHCLLLCPEVRAAYEGETTPEGGNSPVASEDTGSENLQEN